MNTHNRRIFLQKLALGAVTAAIPGCRDERKSASPKRPRNVILFMIDDLGWMDLHCQGNSRLDTPNLDRLATHSMRFSDAYAAAPVCSPTRAAIMTGQAPARLDITNHLPDRPSFQPENAKLRAAKTLDHLPAEHITIAERLKEAGYATAFMGKWHLSGKTKPGDLGRGQPEYLPENQGFDLNIGGCARGGPPTYFDPYQIYNLPPRRTGEYLPDRLADESIKFIQAHQKKPFFLALWNYTVHWPMEAPPDLIDKYEKRVGPGLKDPRYGAMIEAMDAALGRILQTLDELKLTDDTLVIFTSDNGGYSGVADNRPLRDGKGTLYEGGIRVPLIVRWPGVVKPATLCRTPVISMDFYPTILAAAGLKPAEDKILDGESLLPLLQQTGSLRRQAIYFHYPNYAWNRSNRLGGAIRQGDYKLIEHYDDGSVELYNLAEDLSEKQDLSSAKPQLATKLKTKLDDWLLKTDANMPTPIP